MDRELDRQKIFSVVEGLFSCFDPSRRYDMAATTAACVTAREALSGLSCRLALGTDLAWAYRTAAWNYGPLAERHLEMLENIRDLRFLFLYHPNGRIRQAALDRIDEPPPGAFFIAALALRLNDWAAPVRLSARDCAARILPATDPDALAEAAFVLLPRIANWTRWRGEEAPLYAALTRDDVSERIADRLLVAREGATAPVLRQALRRTALDHRLLELAKNAILPDVRATALATLCEGRAIWPVGWGWEWVDKRYGLRRRIRLTESREIIRPVPLGVLIERAASDKCRRVRRVAAYALLAHRDTLPNALELAEIFAADSSARVRAPAQFMLEKARDAR